MGKKLTIAEEINAFLEMWDCKQIISFLRDMIPLFDVYNIDDESDWIEDITNGDEEEARVLRLIRTVYLISKLCDHHAGRMCQMNIKFKDLYKRMEKNGIGKEIEN